MKKEDINKMNDKMNSHIYTEITYSQVPNNLGWGWEY